MYVFSMDDSLKFKCAKHVRHSSESINTFFRIHMDDYLFCCSETRQDIVPNINTLFQTQHSEQCIQFGVLQNNIPSCSSEISPPPCSGRVEKHKSQHANEWIYFVLTIVIWKLPPRVLQKIQGVWLHCRSLWPWLLTVTFVHTLF